MTRHQAEQTAVSLRTAGWPIVYVEVNDDGTWRAVAEDPVTRDGWLTRLLLSRVRGSFTRPADRLS
jgi:hypothetical protein